MWAANIDVNCSLTNAALENLIYARCKGFGGDCGSKCTPQHLKFSVQTLAARKKPRGAGRTRLGVLDRRQCGHHGIAHFAGGYLGGAFAVDVGSAQAVGQYLLHGRFDLLCGGFLLQ